MQAPPEWAGKTAQVTGFIQRSPDNGRSATESTDVLLGYDQRALHIISLPMIPIPGQSDPAWSHGIHIRKNPNKRGRRGLLWEFTWTHSAMVAVHTNLRATHSVFKRFSVFRGFRQLGYGIRCGLVLTGKDNCWRLCSPHEYSVQESLRSPTSRLRHGTLL